MTPPKGKYLFGMVKVGERGQIVIPKQAREVFGIQPGDSLLLLGDEKQGLAIVRKELTEQVLDSIFRACGKEEADGSDHHVGPDEAVR